MHNDSEGSSLSAYLRWLAEPIAQQLRDFWHACLNDIPLLTRVASHVGLLALIVLAIAAGSLRFESKPEVAIASSGGDNSVDTSLIPTDVDVQSVETSVDTPPLSINPIPQRVRRDVEQYTVKPGDTVSDIADTFGISPDSVLWANPKLNDDPDMLSIGQVLSIPPVSGVLYTVARGDTIAGVAAKYRGKQSANDVMQDIVNSEFNIEHQGFQPPDYLLTAGEFLMIPGGVKPYVAKVVPTSPRSPAPTSAARGTGRFGWPVTGRITQRFWAHHPGIDIAAPTGTPIYAADAGYVMVAAWDNERISYGNMILINHGNGYVTRYAHLSAFNVKVGQSVKKGQVIGRVGSTGHSTGPHLHFEIIKNGVRYNPFSFLK